MAAADERLMKLWRTGASILFGFFRRFSCRHVVVVQTMRFGGLSQRREESSPPQSSCPLHSEKSGKSL
jgi:hypothetical protein